MTLTRARSFAIVANGFADGPAQALRDYLTARGARVFVVSHPLAAEDGTRHVVTTYAGEELVARRTLASPLRPPSSFVLDPFVPLRFPPVDVWFGFNPLACARGLIARTMRRASSVVLWSVDFVPDRFGRGTAQTRLYDRLDELCCRRADARVELSEAAREGRNLRHGLLSDRAAHVVPMGAWLERVQTVGTEGYEARRLAFLAHLVRRQGADILLDALAVLGSQAGIAADVIGSGPLEDDLRARARALGLEDVVTFHGFLDDHREVERLLASASLGMAPYRPGEMSFTAYADPGKLKAYLAAGLPILMTDVPPNARELARDGGAEIVPFEATAIAETVLRVLESPETWKKRSEAARSYARRFDWPLLFDELMASLSLEVVPGR
jgi:glycosyltransferase involved in cell wall biosynthesis